MTSKPDSALLIVAHGSTLNPDSSAPTWTHAREIAPDVDPSETALLIVAHGTELNDNSAIAAKREAERIRARGEFATVLNAYMEEPPLIAEWDQLTSAPNVIVVPFFIADGLHSYEDIPRLLGIECTGMDVFRK